MSLGLLRIKPSSWLHKTIIIPVIVMKQLPSFEQCLYQAFHVYHFFYSCDFLYFSDVRNEDKVAQFRIKDSTLTLHIKSDWGFHFLVFFKTNF